MKQIRKRLTYANVMSSIAVFLVLGGATAFAAINIPANSVGTPQLKKNAVKTGKVAFEAIRAGKLSKNAVPNNRLRDNAVSASKIADGSVLTDKIADESVASGKLGKDSVLTDKIQNSAVTEEKLSGDSVSTGKIVNSAVSTDKLAGGAVTAGKVGAIQNVLTTKSVPLNGTLDEVLACPAGGRALSGGYFTSATGVVQITRFRPNGDNGWAFSFKNNSGSNSGVDIYVRCLLG